MRKIHSFGLAGLLLLCLSVSCRERTPYPNPAKLDKRDPESMPLSFQTDGQIEELAVTTGQSVAIGDLLVRLASDQADDRVRRARQALEEAELQLQQARTNHLKVLQQIEASRLEATAVMPSEQQLRLVDQLRAGALADWNQANRQREWCWLYAPAPGTVLSIPVKSNQAVTAGQPVVILQPPR